MMRSNCALEDWLPSKDSTRRGAKLEPIALTISKIVSADRPELTIAETHLLGATPRYLVLHAGFACVRTSNP